MTETRRWIKEQDNYSLYLALMNLQVVRKRLHRRLSEPEAEIALRRVQSQIRAILAEIRHRRED